MRVASSCRAQSVLAGSADGAAHCVLAPRVRKKAVGRPKSRSRISMTASTGVHQASPSRVSSGASLLPRALVFVNAGMSRPPAHGVLALTTSQQRGASGGLPGCVVGRSNSLRSSFAVAFQFEVDFCGQRTSPCGSRSARSSRGGRRLGAGNASQSMERASSTASSSVRDAPFERRARKAGSPMTSSMALVMRVRSSGSHTGALSSSRRRWDAPSSRAAASG